jgi:hypothetical protein
MSGLLTPRKSPMMEMADEENQVQRVLGYMRDIREAMKVDKDVV